MKKSLTEISALFSGMSEIFAIGTMYVSEVTLKTAKYHPLSVELLPVAKCGSKTL
jgi:hypothetical protein